MDRRRFLTNGSAAAVFAGLKLSSPNLLQAAPPMTLKDFGAPCGLKIGFAAAIGRLKGSAPFAAFVKENCNLMTPNSELKWVAVRPTQETYDFSAPDWMLNFAQQSGIAMRGHNLCWNGGNPAWLTKVLTRSNAESILVDHIQHVAGHYAGKLDSWDVVNEPLALWFNKPGGLYPGPWLDTLGPEYIDVAFHAAAAADPGTLRVLNVHHVEQGGDERTRLACLALLASLLQRKVPIQAIGIESHLDASLPLDQDALNRFVGAVKGMGLQILITELDVNDSKVDGDIPRRDQVTADYYRRYLDIMLPVANPTRLVFWSLTDDSWMDYMHTPQWQRSDGSYTHRPGILDTTSRVKPGYNAVVASLQNNCRQ